MWWPRPWDPPDLDGGASGRRAARTTRNGRTVHFGATVLIWTGCGSSMAPKSGRCYAHAGEPTVLAAGARSGAAVRLSEPADAVRRLHDDLEPGGGAAGGTLFVDLHPASSGVNPEHDPGRRRRAPRAVGTRGVDELGGSVDRQRSQQFMQ